MVLETAAPYCPAERVINNKGDFRYDFLVLECVSYIDIDTDHIHAYMILQGQLRRHHLFYLSFLHNIVGRRSTVWFLWEMAASASRAAVACESQRIFLLIPQCKIMENFKRCKLFTTKWERVQNCSLSFLSYRLW